MASAHYLTLGDQRLIQAQLDRFCSAVDSMARAVQFNAADQDEATEAKIRLQMIFDDLVAAHEEYEGLRCQIFDTLMMHIKYGRSSSPYYQDDGVTH